MKTLTRNAVMPLSMERNRDTKRRSPKTKEKTRRFVPKGNFLQHQI